MTTLSLLGQGFERIWDPWLLAMCSRHLRGHSGSAFYRV